MAAEATLTDLHAQFQSGSRLTMRRDAQDRLTVVASEGPDAPAAGSVVLGFGQWPTWSSNVRNKSATLPDQDSGLFEPERLFVLREQYLFVGEGRSYGPLHKVWWAGTEKTIQARAGGRH